MSLISLTTNRFYDSVLEQQMGTIDLPNGSFKDIIEIDGPIIEMTVRPLTFNQINDFHLKANKERSCFKSMFL